jgi:formate hydrogenlyase transcriptional activator
MNERILIVDDNQRNIQVLAGFLANNDYQVEYALDGPKALEWLKEEKFDLVILDVMMPVMDGFQVCQTMQQDRNMKDIPVIFLTARADSESIIRGFQAGGVDYISKPFNSWELLTRVKTHIDLKLSHDLLKNINLTLEEKVNLKTAELKEAFENLRKAYDEIKLLKEKLQSENTLLREEIRIHKSFDEIIGQNDSLQKVLKQVSQVASTDATVLIMGETGTGKELIARAIFNNSNRKSKPFVKINCASIPATLIESELFGHEKGAFTGALSKKIGRFELADNGTLFLDEIGELPPELQPKLLRVIQEGEFERIGSNTTIRVDVRIVAATNRNLLDEVHEGRFRSDLYYRLNVFPIHLPSLRERKSDIPELVRYFVSRSAKKFNKEIHTISPSDLKQLSDYNWPGNIRELENIVERAVILSTKKTLEIGDWMFSKQKPGNTRGPKTLEMIEKEHIEMVLQLTNWRIRGENGAANILGLKPTTLESRMLKLGIYRSS